MRNSMVRILIVGLALAFGAATSATAQFAPPAFFEDKEPSFQDKEKAPNPASPQKNAPAKGTESKSAPAEGTETKNARRDSAKIGPQDVLDISVFQVPELSKTLEV